jgi:hypothetical protein
MRDSKLFTETGHLLSWARHGVCNRSRSDQNITVWEVSFYPAQIAILRVVDDTLKVVVSRYDIT